MIDLRKNAGPVPPEGFADRTDLRREAKEWLSSSKAQRVWFVEGPRDQGKSSFGVWCEEMANRADAWLPLFVSFDDPELRKEPRPDEILERILWAAREKAHNSEWKAFWHNLRKFAALLVDFLTGGDFIRKFIPHRPFATTTATVLFKRLKRIIQATDYRLLLILDEVKARPQIPLQVGDFAKKVSEDEDDLVRLIVLGLPDWRRKLTLEQNPSKFGRRIELPPFSGTDIGEFMEAYFGPREDVNVGPGTSTVLLELTGGIPSLLQTICADARDIALKEARTGVARLKKRHLHDAATFGPTVRSRAESLLEYSGLKENIWVDDPDSSWVAAVLTKYLPALPPGISIADARKEVFRQCGEMLSQDVFDEVLGKLTDTGVVVVTGSDPVALRLRCGLFEDLLPNWVGR